MSKATEVITRRTAFSLLGLGLVTGATGVVLAASRAEAQTPGMDRREERREDRRDRREDRRENRQERRDDRREGREDRRDERRGTNATGH